MRSLVLLSIILSLAGCYDKNYSLKCDNLRIGEFGFREGERRYKIERNDSVQIEIDESNDSVIEFDIKWMSSCEYELTFKRVIKKGKDTSYMQFKFPIVRTRITSIKSGQYYIFKSKVEGSSTELMDTMQIIRLVGGFKSLGESFKQE